MFAEFFNELVVTVRIAFVFRVNDFLELQANRVPRDLFTVGVLRSTNEEAA